jgi:GNAT superfamily N-acetyltransferase
VNEDMLGLLALLAGNQPPPRGMRPMMQDATRVAPRRGEVQQMHTISAYAPNDRGGVMEKVRGLLGMSNLPQEPGLLGKVASFVGLNEPASMVDGPARAMAAVGRAGGMGDDIAAFADEVKNRLGLKHFSVFDRKNGDIVLDMIEVPKEARGAGVGSEAMRELVARADAEGKRVLLTPGLRDELHGTTSRSRLVKFYKQFGFVENKGRAKDFTISEGMYRDPRKGK